LGPIPSDSWLWESTGDYELEVGKTKIALCNLTGYFARCAAILITNDFPTQPRVIETTNCILITQNQCGHKTCPMI